MNFLAHLYLSGDDEKLMIGNFIGDFVKGSQLITYDSEIQQGILLHRAIDTYTDAHPVVLESKKRLRLAFRHYAPVIVDIYYDHFLARKWDHYSSQPLLEFTRWFYKTIATYKNILPNAVFHMLTFMERDNWLYHYQTIEGIDRALTGLSRRTKFTSNMEHAAAALEQDYAAFEDEFDRFFPDLQKFVSKFES